MSSFEIHKLGLFLELVNGYLRPTFEEGTNNSADSYDYGNGFLLGMRQGAAKLLEHLDGIPTTARTSQGGGFDIRDGLKQAIAHMTELHNDVAYDVHKHPREMAVMLHMLMALLAAVLLLEQDGRRRS